MMQILLILSICLVVATVVFFVTLSQEQRAGAAGDRRHRHGATAPSPSEGSWMWGSAVAPVFGISLVILSAISFDYIKTILVGGREMAAERLILERSVAEVRANLAVMERSCAASIPAQQPTTGPSDKIDINVCRAEVKEKTREIERIIESLRATMY
jgi:hypothetical protein